MEKQQYKGEHMKYLALSLLLITQVCSADWWVTQHQPCLYEVSRELPVYTHTEWHSIPDTSLSNFFNGSNTVDVVRRDCDGNPSTYLVNKGIYPK